METTITTKPKLPIVSHKEVAIEIENEVAFLNSDINHNEFKIKGSFLSNIGFKNSIATKIYNDVVDKKDVLKYYQQTYPFYKFILHSQLERVCEKYNLYVRKIEDFCGDIPSENIEHMMNFRMSNTELPNENLNFFNYLIRLWTTTHNYQSFYSVASARYISIDEIYSCTENEKESFFKMVKSSSRFDKQKNYGTSKSSRLDTRFNIVFESLLNNLYKEIHPSEIFNIPNKFGTDIFKINFPNIDFSKKLSLEDIAYLNEQEIFDENLILIAAVKDLFTDEAFKESDKRIFKGNIKQPPMHELPPKLQVDIDPIVLVQTRHGYLIVTAWGDEANDETVLNKNFN